MYNLIPQTSPINWIIFRNILILIVIVNRNIIRFSLLNTQQKKRIKIIRNFIKWKW